MSYLPGVSRNAMERVLRHYGLEPTREAWLSAVLSILDRTAILVKVAVHPDSVVEHWLVRLGREDVVLVWLPAGGVAVSALPLPNGWRR